MDLKEIKRLVSYAKRNGLKRLKIDGLEIELQDAIVFPTRKRGKLSAVPGGKEESIPAPPPEPTLDQVNEYIYGNPGEVG